MGLLDNFGASFGNMTNDPKQMGLLMAAAQMMAQSGPSNRPVGLGEVMGGGMSTFLNTRNAMQQQQADQQEREQAQQYRGMQMQNLQQEQEKSKALLARGAKVQEVLKGYQSPRNQMLATMSGPTLANAEQLAQLPQGGDMYSDLMGRAQLLSNEGLTEEAMKMAEVASKFKPKFDTTPRVANGPDGKPFTYILDEMGNPKRLDGYMPREEKKLLNLNNKFQAVNPFEVSDGASFTIGRSADNVASVNATLARLNYDKSQALAPTFNAELGGFVSRPNSQNPQGSFTPLAGMAPRGPKMTEDQAKATGWLVQAENAWKNMQSVGLDDKRKPTDAARPGFNDALAGIPSLGVSGAVANMLRSPERQQFMQSSSSLSEALLRAATGAGVTEAEAEQKVRELTPVFGDTEENIAQKMAAIPMYIESLRARAGPGAGVAAGVMGSNSGAAASGQWSIKRKN